MICVLSCETIKNGGGIYGYELTKQGILKKAGYDGDIAYEFEGPEENIDALKNGLAYLKGVIG